MSVHLQRGRILLQQGRIDMAQKELRQELSNNPTHADAIGLMALCHLHKKENATAIELIESAIGLEPNNVYLFYLQASIYLDSNRIKDAEIAADNGLRLSPFTAEFFLIKGEIAHRKDDWGSTLKFAEQGLEIDPENINLINLRARALIQLNRRKEASATLDYALNKSPEDPLAHTNKGWVAIENDNYEEAVTHFKEALRLSPTFAFAKTGLKEAIKGKNIFYRQILKFFLWTNKMTDQGRWQLLIGAFIIYQVILRVAENYPGVAPLLYPFIIAYVLFVFSTWIARPVSNLFLRIHPLGKLALSDDEKLASNIVGLFIFLGLTSIVAYFILNIEALVVLGIWFIIMLIPLGGVFGMERGTQARKYLLFYTILLGVLGLGFIAMPYIDFFAYTFLLGIFFYGWVANYLVMKESKRV